MITEQSLFSIILPPTVSMARLTSMPVMPWHGALRFRGPRWRHKIYLLQLKAFTIALRIVILIGRCDFLSWFIWTISLMTCLCVRFAHSFPAMPRLSVPHFNRNSPHCHLSGVRRPPSVSRMKPLDRLDAAHFFSTGSTAQPSPTPHDGNGSPRLPSVIGGNVAEEYRLLASGTHSPVPAAVPQRHSYLELLDLDSLRIVFLLLDALLLLYRITNVYMGGLVVSRRFEDDAVIVSGRWATPSPTKTSTRLATTVRSPSPVGATNYIDAGDYLQPVELRSADPPASSTR